MNKTDKIAGLIIYIYCFFLFVIYPLVIHSAYVDIAEAKYYSFLVVTVIMLFSMLIVAVCDCMYRLKHGIKLSGFEILDYMMLAYGIAAVISYAFSGYDEALWGMSGWYMGLLSQLIFVGMYFAISYGVCRLLPTGIMDSGFMGYAIMASSSAVMLVGIMQRLGIDMFDWYSKSGILPEDEFFSTMGQVSWYSSYLALVVCFAGYLVCERGKSLGNRIIYSIYTLLVGIAVICADSQALWGSVVIVILVCVFLEWGQYGRYISVRNRIYVGLIAICLITIIFMIYNSRLSADVAFMGFDGLLYFDNNWGNRRGVIWMQSIRAFGGMSAKEKMIGVGPDCFYHAAYAVDTSEMSAIMSAARVECAHNEWLNSVICYGITGGLIYLGIFVVALCKAFKSKANQVKISYIGMAVLVYIFYEAFAYQTYYATPMIITLIALMNCRFIHADRL